MGIATTIQQTKSTPLHRSNMLQWEKHCDCCLAIWLHGSIPPGPASWHNDPRCVKWDSI